jgi:adenosine deaminase
MCCLQFHSTSKFIVRCQVKSQWIACFLRDLPLESSMEHYELLLPYKDMVVGIGLDSNEYSHPPSLFYSLYQRARNEGFKLTCHCDVAQPATHTHIRQVAEFLGGTGAERIDHGLDAASEPSLIQLIKEKGTGMTLCPWAYVRHHREENVFGYLRKLFDEDVKVMISSDSPVYVEDHWLEENLKLIRLKTGFTDAEFVQLMRNSVEICWASQEVKREFTDELEMFISQQYY